MVREASAYVAQLTPPAPQKKEAALAGQPLEHLQQQRVVYRALRLAQPPVDATDAGPSSAIASALR